MRDRDPGVSVQTMPLSGTEVRAHAQASLRATTRDAPFILIILIILIIISPFASQAERTQSCTHFSQMRSVFAS
jgi:hypothetical protein